MIDNFLASAAAIACTQGSFSMSNLRHEQLRSVTFTTWVDETPDT